jgi:hypothetical protein
MPRKRPRVADPSISVPIAESVCFEIRHNGKRVRRAGFTGYGILDTSLTWRRPHPVRDPGQTDALSLHVGGVDHTLPAWNRQLFWDLPIVRVGDRVEIRVTDSSRVDAASVSRVRVRPRLEPPPIGAPARTDGGGATMWLEPRGLCLRTYDRRWGGPTVLSPAEARRLAAALLDAAHRSERSRG